MELNSDIENRYSSNDGTNEHGSTDRTQSMPIGQKVRLAFELANAQRTSKASNTIEPDITGMAPGVQPFRLGLSKEVVADTSSCDNDSDAHKETNEILRALRTLSNQENTCLCRQLELLVRFDELQGWREAGAKNCAAWMNSELHIDLRTGWERLRVGKQLRELPIIHKLFQSGRLSWSKVRLLTRIANPENESMLAHASLDSTVSDVQRICEEYRWPELEDDESEALRANLQWERRRLNWSQLPDGSTQIKLVLPPERAQNFLHALEHCEELLYEEGQLQSTREIEQNSNVNHGTENHGTENVVREDAPRVELSSSQRKADAAVLLAERSIAFTGEHLTPADRYQVVLNIDTDSLNRKNDVSLNHEALTRNPIIEGMGRVPTTTARQIACDCSIIKLLTEQGEPLSVGRKHRLWTPSMRRAILTRDRHCQFTGCTSHRFLQIHHIKHWADGGDTSVENAVCLCQYHHQLIHSGEFQIKRATVNTDSLQTSGLFSISKKKLLPTRCRFVVERITACKVGNPSKNDAGASTSVGQNSILATMTVEPKDLAQSDPKSTKRPSVEECGASYHVSKHPNLRLVH